MFFLSFCQTQHFHIEQFLVVPQPVRTSCTAAAFARCTFDHAEYLVPSFEQMHPGRISRYFEATIKFNKAGTYSFKSKKYCKEIPELKFLITGQQFNASESRGFTVDAAVPNAPLLVTESARVDDFAASPRFCTRYQGYDQVLRKDALL